MAILGLAVASTFAANPKHNQQQHHLHPDQQVHWEAG